MRILHIAYTHSLTQQCVHVWKARLDVLYMSSIGRCQTEMIFVISWSNELQRIHKMLPHRLKSQFERHLLVPNRSVMVL